MTPESLEKLVSWNMPFGKHAGTLLADLPGNYLAWFAREGFPEGKLGQLLERCIRLITMIYGACWSRCGGG